MAHDVQIAFGAGSVLDARFPTGSYEYLITVDPVLLVSGFVAVRIRENES